MANAAQLDDKYNASMALARLKEADTRNKGEQTGSVRFKSGSWYIRFREWRPVDGEWKWADTERKVEDNGKKLSKTQALLLGNKQWVSKANELNRAPQGHMTVAFFVEHHYIPTVMKNWAPGWRDNAKSLIHTHIFPAFGALEIHEVRRSMVQAWITRKEAERSTQLVKHMRNLLRSIFQHAIRLEFSTNSNPADDVILATLTHRERPAWTMEQIRQLAAALHAAGQAEYARLTLLLSLTGLRIGEMMGLRWQAVDFDKRTIEVKETWARGRRGKTKTDASVRLVPLTGEALEILQSHLSTTKWNGAAHPVFAGSTGKALNAGNILRRHVKPAAVKLGMAEFDWHSERHTTATLVDRHATAAEKQALLGHTTEEMGVRYTHPEMERMREALEKATGVVN